MKTSNHKWNTDLYNKFIERYIAPGRLKSIHNLINEKRYNPKDLIQ